MSDADLKPFPFPKIRSLSERGYFPIADGVRFVPVEIAIKRGRQVLIRSDTKAILAIVGLASLPNG